MSRDPIRRQVVYEAARLIYLRDESDYHRAKMKAAWRVYGAQFRTADLPGNREVREQIIEFARGDHRQIRPEDLGLMRELSDMEAIDPRIDRFHVYAMLLRPLEKVKEDRASHPEGDLLYHSLQVFELARQELPYDEEFLLAALLHDSGKAVDPREHVSAALDALAGFITPRTAWLIEHHSEALALEDRTIGARCLRRLQSSEDFDELRLLARCDRQGHRVGVPVPDVDDALEYVRNLAEMCDQ